MSRSAHIGNAHSGSGSAWSSGGVVASPAPLVPPLLRAGLSKRLAASVTSCHSAAKLAGHFS